MRKNFTLIELLVVIAIIGILITMLLPSLAKARNEARAVLCINNQRQLSIGNLAFTKNHNGGIVKTEYPRLNTYIGWEYALKPYLGKDYIVKRQSGNTPAGVALCPAYEDLSFQYVKSGASVSQRPDYGNDSDGAPSRGRKDYLSYGINQFLSNMKMNDTGYPGNGTGAAGSWFTTYNKTYVRLAEIEHPNETMLFTETFDTAKLTKFEDAYFNPNHNRKLPFSKIDGSTARIHYKSIQTNGPQLNNSGNALRNLPEWDQNFWGVYVSPKY